MSPKQFGFAVAATAVGVVVAGFLMYMARDLPLINDARNGFDT